MPNKPKIKKEVIGTSVTPEFREWVEKTAKEESRTLAGQIAKLLNEAKAAREQANT